MKWRLCAWGVVMGLGVAGPGWISAEEPVSMPSADAAASDTLTIACGPTALYADGELIANLDFGPGFVPDAGTWRAVLEPVVQARQAALAPGVELGVVLAMDVSLSHGLVVSLIDALRQMGVTRYSIAVAPPDAPPEAPATP